MCLECFRILREKWEGHGYDLDSIKKIDLNKDSILSDILSDTSIEIKKLGWRGNKLLLSNRINTILKRKNYISVREERFLRSLVRQTKVTNDKVDFSRFTYYFPGKSEAFLRKYYYSREAQNDK